MRMKGGQVHSLPMTLGAGADGGATPGVWLVAATPGAGRPLARGFHSLTSQLNLSTFCGIGGALRDCVARVTGVLENV